MIDQARIVIVGGGVGGCSIAYHLALMGCRDVVVLEKGELTSGSTWHSAGLVGQLRSSITLTRMMMYSAELYPRLSQETGQDTGWRPVGSLRLASTEDRLIECRRQVSSAKTFGLPLDFVSLREAQEMFPLISLEGVRGAIYIPTDGHVDPSGLTMALAKGARSRGAQIITGVEVTGVRTHNGRVAGVVTNQGEVKCEVLVNAAGMWAPALGRMAGVTIPIVPMAHQYLITKPIPGHELPPTAPTLRDPDNLVYFREEVRGILMGGYERHPAPWALDGVPPGFNFQLLDPDWDRFDELMEGALRRVPVIGQAEIVKLINGPEAFTPDNEFILGEAPGLKGFFVAAGFCAHGIAGAGGIGKVMAEWILEGEPSLDLWEMDIRRFGPHYASGRYTLDRVHETYRTYYDIHFPHEERQAGRPLRLSPMYGRLKELGAVFGEKAGWERANWFERERDLPAPRHEPHPWLRRHWSPYVEREALAVRRRAGLFDVTSFAKLEIRGPGALAFLQRIAANEMDRPPGSITYTQLLNRRGGIECDLTVTRLGEQHFFLITGTAFGTHDLGWILNQAPEDGSVFVQNVTSQFAAVGLWGPKARDILQAATADDVSNPAFPYLTCRHITVGAAPVRALRVTYVGELGWELYTPAEYGLQLWDALWAAGRPHGLEPAGYRAIDALRLEKGYRYWSADITPEETPYEAGLGFCVRLEKGEFTGRAALEQQRAAGLTRRLCCLTLADPARLALGGEPVLAPGGRVVGRVTSGGYGYAVGRSIALAYLPPAHARPGTALAVEVFGEAVAATVLEAPLWDPAGERIRA